MNNKELATTAGAVVWVAITWALVALLLQRPSLDVLWWVILTILVILQTAVLALALSVTQHWGTRLALLVIPAMTVAVLGLHVSSVLGGLLLLLAAWMGSRSLREEIGNRLQYRVWPMYGPGVRLLLLASLLGVIGLAYVPLLGAVNRGGLRLSPAYVSLFLKPLEPLLTSTIPGYKSDQSVNDFINAQLQQEQSQLPPGTTVPSQEQAVLRTQLSQRFGQSLTGAESVSSIIAGKVNQYVDSTVRSYPQLVTLIVLVSLALTIRFLLPFLAWPTLGVIALLMWFGRQVGLFTLTEEQRTIQRLTL